MCEGAAEKRDLSLMAISKPGVPPPSGVVTAMFTDIVDSTRLKGMIEADTSARRDARFRLEIKDAHDAIVLTCVQEAGGYLVNPTGDGFCFTFVDAEEAVLCALRIQKNLQLHPIHTPLGALQVRIGLHTGIAGPSGGDYIASTIDKTARVQGQAGGGEVFVSNQTHVLVDGRASGVAFEKAGTFDLKGLRAEELYRVVTTAELQLAPVASDPNSAPRSPLSARSINDSRGPQPVSRAAPIVGAVVISGGLFWWGRSLLPQNKNTASSPVSKSPVAQTQVSRPTVASGTSLTRAPLSKWSGTFRFLPPTPTYNGSAELTITKRNGEAFEGVYASENRHYQWLIEATLKGRNIRWEFVKSLKSLGKQDAVGKDYSEGIIEGDLLKGFFRMKDNPQERAELKLRRDS